MKYSNLIDILNKEEKHFGKITKLYLLKVGCVSYGDKTEDPSKTEKDELMETLEPDKVFQETADALKKHPHVFDLTVKADENSSTTGTEKHVFINAGLLKLRIEQPKRFQKYSTYSNTKTIEKFDVISNGSTFIAYAPVSDFGEGGYMAHEYREIVEKQINEETKNFNPSLGPCPIHPDIYLAFTDYSKTEKKEGEESQEEETTAIDMILVKDDLILLIDNRLPFKDILSDTLHIIDNGIIEFYRLMAIRSELLSYNSTLHDLFETISTKTVERLNTPWYFFQKLQKLTNEARKSLSTAYILFVEYDNVLLTHAKLRESYQVDVKENEILSNFSSYLLEHTQHDSEMPNSFKDSINHFEKEIHLFNNLKTVLLASVFGAVLGSVLTALLTVALTNKSQAPEKAIQRDSTIQTSNILKLKKDSLTTTKTTTLDTSKGHK